VRTQGPIRTVSTSQATDRATSSNIKSPAGNLTTADTRENIERTTDLFPEIYGERARATTVVLVDEVVDGG
jgi:4-oxalocrotonate tautomerase